MTTQPGKSPWVSAQHRRPLLAFFLVVACCAFVIGHAVRAEAVRTLIAAGVPAPVVAMIAPGTLDTVLNSSLEGGVQASVPLGAALRYAGQQSAPPVTDPAPVPVRTVSAASYVRPVAARAAKSQHAVHRATHRTRQHAKPGSRHHSAHHGHAAGHGVGHGVGPAATNPAISPQTRHAVHQMLRKLQRAVQAREHRTHQAVVKAQHRAETRAHRSHRDRGNHHQGRHHKTQHHQTQHDKTQHHRHHHR